MKLPFSFRLLLLVCVLSLVGCAEEQGDGTPSCTVSQDLEPSQMEASVDGTSWTATSSGYQLAGAVGFISAFTVDAHNLLTVRLHHTAVFSIDAEGLIEVDDGEEVADIFEPGAGPMEFMLGSASADGGDVTLTVDDQVLHTNKGDGGGYLYIESVEAGEGNNPAVARGCLYFDAGTDDSDQLVSVTEASFAVAEL